MCQPPVIELQNVVRPMKTAGVYHCRLGVSKTAGKVACIPEI